MYIIAGSYRGRKLFTPKKSETRPTASHLREALFNICQNYIEDAYFLDLFAGSGAIGLEALSRGAAKSTFIEHHREAFHCIQQNIQALGVQDQAQVLQGDVFRMLELLEKKGEKFDLIYADPPYHTKQLAHSQHPSISEKIIQWIDAASLLKPGGVLFLEEAFEFQPHLDDLKTLKLKNSRRISSAILQQYEKCACF